MVVYPCSDNQGEENWQMQVSPDIDDPAGFVVFEIANRAEDDPDCYGAQLDREAVAALVGQLTAWLESAKP